MYYNFASETLKSVVKPIIGRGLYACYDALDVSVTLATNTGHVLGKKVPVRVLTDWKQLFDVITQESN